MAKRPLVVMAGTAQEIPTTERALVDAIQFTTTPSLTPIEATVQWNGTDGTLDIGLKGGNVTLQVGQELLLRAKNISGGTIAEGSVVYVVGASGNRPTIDIAQADTNSTSMSTVGIATETILNNNAGFIARKGLVRQLDTSAFTEGAELWLSSTVAGGITATRPVAPGHSIRIGWCVRSHASLGIILVDVDTGSELQELHDVKITSIANGHTIVWNATLGYWENQPASGGGDAYVGSTNTFTQNQIISVTDNTNAALRITQLGTGNALVVEDSANPDSTPFVINNVGQILKGTTGSLTFQTAGGNNYANPAIVAAGLDGNGASQLFAQFSGSGTDFGTVIALARTAGTVVGDYAVLTSGYTIGILSFNSGDSAKLIEAANIKAAVDGTPGTNDMPGRLVFSTTSDGASTSTERMRIDSNGNISIAGTAALGETLRNSKAMTGATTTYGIYNRGVVQSDSTVSAYYFSTLGGTQAASFTLAALRHYSANQGTVGAGSIITSQYGFEASSGLTGAASNYGFYGNIASAANRWNFYANGTAANSFSGDVQIHGAGKLGYGTGSGGTVTQATSRTTGVTLNKTNGAITLVSAAGLPTWQSFTVTNSTVAAVDTIHICQKSGTDLNQILITNVAAGSFQVTFATTGGTTVEQPVFNFAVIKGATS